MIQRLPEELAKRDRIQAQIGRAIQLGKPWRCIAEKYDPDFFKVADQILSVSSNRVPDYRIAFLNKKQARLQSGGRV